MKLSEPAIRHICVSARIRYTVDARSLASHFRIDAPNYRVIVLYSSNVCDEEYFYSYLGYVFELCSSSASGVRFLDTDAPDVRLDQLYTRSFIGFDLRHGMLEG